MAGNPTFRRRLISYLLAIAAGVVIAALTGRLEPVIVPDSASYLDYSFASFDHVARSIRTPGYPAWLQSIIAVAGLGAVPLCQVVMHATASWWFWLELRRWDMPGVGALLAACAVGVGCTPLDHISTISADALAASLGVMTATATLRGVRRGGSLADAFPPAVLAVVTISLRPAYLFLLVWLPLVVVLLLIRRGVGFRRCLPTAAIVLLLTILPVVGWMGARYVGVGDFGIAPFGHQNLAGILVQLLSDRELRQFGELGSAIADRKAAYLAGADEPADRVPTATMTIDARWDAMTYFVVIPAAGDVIGNDAIGTHRAIGRLNRSIVARWPARYLVWIAKGVRRGAWAIAADIVMHPVFLPMIGLGLLVVVYRATHGSWVQPGWRSSQGLDALAIVAISYGIAKLGFVALSSPPIGRFSDAAAIFLPALGAVIWTALWVPRVPEGTGEGRER